MFFSQFLGLKLAHVVSAPPTYTNVCSDSFALNCSEKAIKNEKTAVTVRDLANRLFSKYIRSIMLYSCKKL